MLLIAINPIPKRIILYQRLTATAAWAADVLAASSWAELSHALAASLPEIGLRGAKGALIATGAAPGAGTSGAAAAAGLAGA